MANTYGYEGTEQYRPLSPWAYLGYSLLFSIPIVGLVLLIVYSFNDTNINRRNFARSIWCSVLVAVIVGLVIVLLSLIGVLPSLSTLSRYYS